MWKKPQNFFFFLLNPSLREAFKKKIKKNVCVLQTEGDLGDLGEPSKKKLRNFGHVAKRGGVSSSGKLFNEEKFGHVFRGGGSKGLVQSSFCKKKVCIEAP